MTGAPTWLLQHRRGLRPALSGIVTLLAAAALATPAQASQAIDTFTTSATTSQAGGHPDLTTSFALDSTSQETAKNVIFNLPEGMFGNSTAISQCTSAGFALNECPANSQAGLITVRGGYQGNPDYLFGTAPIYDVVPQGSDETARFAFVVPTLNLPISIPVAVRTGSDFGLRFTVTGITQLFPLASAEMTFWGFPADSNHDVQRFGKGSPGLPPGCPNLPDTSCISSDTPSSLGVHPLTDNPTICSGGSLTAKLDVQTYQDLNDISHAESQYPPITECDRLTFNPVLQANPTTSETDTASGLDLKLSAPQFLGFAASPSEIRSSTVVLPQGFTINPDAADGQTACTDQQANFGSEGPTNCPNSSKIGTFSIETPALAGPLTGSLYIGQPRPGDQYRLFLIASGFGINAKLIGSFKPNPETGQLTAFFENLPQVPFESFQLHLFASDRGLMATPTRCTIYTITADFVPWDAALSEQTSSQTFGLDSGPHGAPCPGQVLPFSPSLAAGTSVATAGAHSAFALKLDREDGDQFLGKLNFTMPPGLTADLHGITYCPEASIAAAAKAPGRTEQLAPSCAATSQIGTSRVAAGPGSHPFHSVGKIYMAGPFKGAPLSLVAITPALAGPYDYGTVVVRVAIHIDRLDAHVVADSETVPSIIGGIPIRMRSIEVNIDKPNFMINPTNCSPFSVDSEGIGDQGTAVAFSSYFHVVNCSGLGFKPKMSIVQLGGRKQAKRAKSPSIRFDLSTRNGDANIKSIAVTLPNALEINQSHLVNLCTKAELATHCTGRQPIGTVKTETPLLDKPLEGFAYAVSGYGGLPHIVFFLDGQVTVVPQGETKTVGGGRLRTTLPVVPDVPIGHFQLTLLGAGQGYLLNTRSLCARGVSTTVEYAAQNGKSLTQKVPIKAACGGKDKRRKLHRN